MSQIHYSALSHTYGPIDVQTGWDRQTQAYHITVWRIGCDDEDDPVLTDNHFAPQRTLTTFLAALKVLDIPVPTPVQLVLLAHALSNAGNIIVRVNATRTEASDV